MAGRERGDRISVSAEVGESHEHDPDPITTNGPIRLSSDKFRSSWIERVGLLGRNGA